MANPPTKSSPLIIAIAWAIVVVPTAWGFHYTLQSALKIFATPTTAAASTAQPKP